MRLMGGLRKAMPITFILMAIMVITTSGLPPFAAFFSKGLIITSVTDVNLIQAILLYATAAITFAYVIRMLSLVFMGKESEHLQKQHVHEAPKVMLIPAAILAGLCIVWGLSMTVVANFMHLNSLGLSILGSFTDIETPIFLAILVPTGLLVYFAYYKNVYEHKKFGGGSNPIATMLKHAYFFDDFYGVLVKGLNKASEGVKYIEDSANQLTTRFAAGVVTAASKLKKVPSTTVQNYIAAAVVGFILIIVLIILTLGGL